MHRFIYSFIYQGLGSSADKLEHERTKVSRGMSAVFAFSY